MQTQKVYATRNRISPFGAFTLIELLVVIATMGLLSSIVLVALKGGREKANVAKTLEWARSVQSQLGGDMAGSWNFNDITGSTVLDATGYNNGTIYGATTTDGVQGLTGKALQFDGTDDYVAILSVNPREAVTVEAWVKSSSASGYGASWQIVSKYSAYLLGTGSGGGKNMNFIVYRTGVGWTYGSYYNVPDPENWHHFAGTYDGTTGIKKLYVDGVLKINDSGFPGTINADAGPVHIAHREADVIGTNHFNGSIDEVRIYSRALTAMEVQKRYAQGLSRNQFAERR